MSSEAGQLTLSGLPPVPEDPLPGGHGVLVWGPRASFALQAGCGQPFLFISKTQPRLGWAACSSLSAGQGRTGKESQLSQTCAGAGDWLALVTSPGPLLRGTALLHAWVCLRGQEGKELPSPRLKHLRPSLSPVLAPSQGQLFPHRWAVGTSSLHRDTFFPSVLQGPNRLAKSLHN